MIASILLLTTLAGPAAAQAPQPASTVPLVTLPADAAAAFVKISAAEKSAGLCQTQLANTRTRMVQLRQRDTQLRNEQADIARERDAATDAARRVPRQSAEYADAAGRITAALVRMQNDQNELNGIPTQGANLRQEETQQLLCIQSAQNVLKALIAPPAIAPRP